MASHIIMKAGKPYGPDINRPTVEYTGKGNLLCYDTYAGRAFRSSEEAVRKECELFIDTYTGVEGEDGKYVSWADLHELWGIIPTTFDIVWGYSPDPDWRVDMTFDIQLCGPGTSLYEIFGEPVLVIEPGMYSMPIEGYLEY